MPPWPNDAVQRREGRRREQEREENFSLGGRRSPLKGLISAKGIKGNSALFL
jgi:hypothetical protein